MSGKVGLIYSEDFLKYNFDPSHPLQQIRVKLAYELIKSYGLLDNVEQFEPKLGSYDDILWVHDEEYVKEVQKLSKQKPSTYDSLIYLPLVYGLGYGDNPIFEGMYEAAALHVGATKLACELTAIKKIDHVFCLGGGFHHAKKNRASGFCIFNDVAIGIKFLQKVCNIRKVMYVDIDAHHSDGVQEIFYSDPKVLKISFHENGRFLFPGTGFDDEIGEGEGRGYNINIPLPIQTSDDAYLYAFDEIVIPLFEIYEPDVVITQCGVDGHYLDPLTHLSLTTHTYATISERLHEHGHTHNAKWICLGGGGYEISVVPRVWTIMFSKITHTLPGDKIPESWKQLYNSMTGRSAPLTLFDSEISMRNKKEVFDTVKNVVEKLKHTIPLFK